ncbi:helix-turn-helix domain-containing protein [Streptomyces purpurogeneiscleroticus]|uniref:helix-turn-helix domain-containing protein n=1 Tax=Streptomyces purpurogeneiscleroticus TaxID=68259 RepID=UPI001CBDEFAE|nr:helix-turn-helix transcriptional regulator [Streptomyces purpurogeneiscleroticus]MBZ4020353.1 transcriptional regulator [Streptomyces purpurogeneiscleroticus]
MTDAWRYCGNQVKLWRNHAGVSRDALATESGYAQDSVKSMEQGRRRPTVKLLEIADEMCGAHGMLLAARDYLKPARYRSYAQDFMALEEEAIVLQSFEALLIPGLLQTKAYTRALMHSHCPPLDDETVEERVNARIARQQALSARPKTLFGFVIYEAALRTLVGGREVMREQLLHLVEVGRLRNVSVQILPAESGAQPGLSGPFVLLQSADHESYGYVEGQESGVLHTDAEKLTVLAQRHGMIRMQALSAEESAKYLERVADEL